MARSRAATAAAAWLALAAPALTWPRSAGAANASGTIPVLFLSDTPGSAVLAGTRLGIADDAATGRFLGQAFALTGRLAHGPAEAAAIAEAALAAGTRLFVLDLPAAVLLRLADLPAARTALLIDAGSRDDALRGASCRANLVHTAPSRAMLADALMQYLASKNWRRIFLLAGKGAGDRATADAIRRSAEKFQLTVAADRPWEFNPAAQQADTGHFQVNEEVAAATAGVRYDVLVAADEAGAFGDTLAYRTDAPRPVAGTSGLVASGWTPVMDEYAATQLQIRFQRSAGRAMTAAAYAGWAAARAIGEAATRAGSTDPARIIAAVRAEDFKLAGYKGAPMSFRAWDGQLRQPVLLADEHGIVSIAPLPGFLHETNTLDTLGPDRPETECHAGAP